MSYNSEEYTDYVIDDTIENALTKEECLDINLDNSEFSNDLNSEFYLKDVAKEKEKEKSYKDSELFPFYQVCPTTNKDGVSFLQVGIANSKPCVIINETVITNKARCIIFSVHYSDDDLKMLMETKRLGMIEIVIINEKDNIIAELDVDFVVDDTKNKNDVFDLTKTSSSVAIINGRFAWILYYKNSFGEHFERELHSDTLFPGKSEIIHIAMKYLFTLEIQYLLNI
jgi:hypothetical protein